MKITYKLNPLETTIELDENDRMKLWYEIKIEQLTTDMSMAEYYLRDGRIDKAKQELDPNYYFSTEIGKKSKLDERVDMLCKHYEEELLSVHAGDCTCVPCSCSKCHAEEFFGIDTIKGLGKHSAYKVDSAVKKHGSLAKAIQMLENYEPINTNPDWPQSDFEKHIPRWKNEAAHAASWLKNYRDTHFPDDKIVD